MLIFKGQISRVSQSENHVVSLICKGLARPFRSFDVDHIQLQRSRDGQTILIKHYLDSLNQNTIVWTRRLPRYHWYRSWNNFDRPFRSCDLDHISVPRSRDDLGSTLVGFLDPENHILDILITFVAFIHPEITLIDHLGHATLTNYGYKVTWWSDIIDFILFGYLDPENHIPDTLITSVALIHPEIMLINHLGHVTLTNYGFQGHVRVRHYWFYLIWIPWPWKPYPWHSDHLCSINTSWDNVDQSFRSCDFDQWLINIISGCINATEVLKVSRIWFSMSRNPNPKKIKSIISDHHVTLKTIVGQGHMA